MQISSVLTFVWPEREERFFQISYNIPESGKKYIRIVLCTVALRKQNVICSSPSRHLCNQAPERACCSFA